MRCPCCSHIIHATADTCPHCGGCVAEVDVLYGEMKPEVMVPHDVAGALRAGERARVRSMIRRIEARFPDVTFVVATVSLDYHQDVKSYGFWLMNRGEISFGDRRQDGVVVLVLDVEGKEACLHFGYLLDAVIDEREAFEVLARAHPYWLGGEYVAGLEVACKGLSRYLRRCAKRLKRMRGGLE